jgi:hypothetical protein
VRQKQRQQRSHTGRRYRGKNRDGMNIAFIKNAQHDVDSAQCGEDQDQHIGTGILESLSRSLPTRLDGGWKTNAAFRFLNCIRRLAESDPRRQVERDRDRRHLPLVIHRQRRVRGLVARKGGQRHGRSGGRAQINVLQGFRSLLELRCNFHDHVILVQRPVHSGDLPLSKRVVQGVV